MTPVYIKDGILYICIPWLREEFKISEKTTQEWGGGRDYDEKGRSCIAYSNIPRQTRAKLHPENDLIGMANEAKFDRKKNGFASGMLNAYNNEFLKYREYFKTQYPTLPAEKITRAAKKYAVWLYILDLVQNQGVRNNAHLFAAFKEVLPGQYKDEQNFANAKGKAVKNGAESMAIDARWFEAPKNITRVNELNQFWVDCILSMNKKYNYPEIVSIVNAACDEKGLKRVTLSWVKKYCRQILKTNAAIHASRNGRDAARERMGYLKTKRAKHANTRWFMDGKQIPLYGLDFVRYQMVLIMDDYSRKIIGYAFGKSENTTVIMSALKMAITETGCLPKELISDKHSFHQTSQASYFKRETGLLGMEFEADTNPQKKSPLERGNQTLDSLFKRCYGYTGGGLKSKRDSVRPSDDYRDEAARNGYTEDTLFAHAVNAILEFNRMEVKGKTRDELYKESEKPYCINLSIEEKVRVLTETAKYRVRNGRIVITLASVKHEYTLNAKQRSLYDNGDVIVRYEDLHNSIYVFTADKDEFIGELKPALEINGAKQDQTEEDTKIRNKHSGHLSGYDTTSRKRNKSIKDAALLRNPDAIEDIARHAADKDLRQKCKQDAELRRLLINQGINPDNIYIPQAKPVLNLKAIMPVEKSPKHTIKAKGDCQPIDFAKEFNNE